MSVFMIGRSFSLGETEHARKMWLGLYASTHWEEHSNVQVQVRCVNLPIHCSFQKQVMIQAAASNRAYTLLQRAIGEALECLGHPRLADKRVHAARKAVKKARATLRLLRPAMNDADYRKENAALLEAGQRLSPLRDAISLIDVFNALVSRYATELRGVELAPLHRWLLAKHTHARHALLDAPEELRLCADALEGCRDRMRRSNLAHAGHATTIEGLRRIYRKGRKALARARHAQTSEVLHEWRKQVKYLFNAMASLSGSRAHDSRKALKRAERVANWLGDDHDLAMLHNAIRDSAIDTGVAAILNGLVTVRRAKLQARAFHDGRKLFARKPRRFVTRI
jgi:CHAD domain-containing protein